MADTPGVQDLLHFVNWNAVPVALTLAVGGLVGLRLWSRFLDDLGERVTQRRLVLKKVKAISRFFAYAAIIGVSATLVLQIEQRSLVALFGAAGLALGFGFQDLLASLVAGIILLIDEPFQVGDRIAFGDYYGEVAEIGLRSVRLITLDDNLVTVPNSAFLSQSVASANAGALDCMVVLPFYIAAAENFDRAQRIVKEATATSRYVYLEKPIVTLIADEFLGERFVTVIRVKAYVFDARYEKAFASDVTERVKRAFRKTGIRAPDQQYRDLDLNQGQETPGPLSAR